MFGGGPSRRSLLRGAGALGLGATLVACETGGGSASGGGVTVWPSSGRGADVSDTERTVSWANYILYLDKDDAAKTYPTLEAFKKKTGITPTYIEEIEDNDAYYGRIQAQLRQGQDFGRDLIVFTDWMAGRVVRAGWAQELDKKNIPNAVNILEPLRNVDYDRGRNHSLTWQSGFTGLGWNVARLKELTGRAELRTIDELWNPRLRGRVEVLSEMRDTIGLILLDQGVRPDRAFTSDTFDNAVSVLERQLAVGQIRQVRGNSYTEDLVSGDVVAVIGWSGDILQLNHEAASGGAKAGPYGFAIPESGGMLWSDNLLVPIGARHKTNAEVLMNYYYDPKVAAQVARYINYICPVKGAREEIVKIKNVGPRIARSPYIFPTPEMLAKVHVFRSLSAQEEKDFTGAFQSVLGV